jgi:ACS family hexuronate transporter-like MFS transporter
MNLRIATPQLRWLIAGLLLGVTLINYLDRLTMSVLVGDIRQSLNLSENDYAQIVSLFFVAYAIMYPCSGYIVDRLGTKLGMATFVFIWSVSQMLHGLAGGKCSFAACRFGLGLAEPGSFPAATKAIGEWFPINQRALGVGIFNTGSSLGAALAAPLVAFLAIHYGWRAAFIFTGAAGILWMLLWLVIYESPPGSNKLTKKEMPQSGELVIASEIPLPTKQVNWVGVACSRAGFMLILARFLTDPVIYFVVFWLPAYLEKERGFDLAMIGRYAWLPYAVGGIGYLIGGWLPALMMSRGWSVSRSRKTTMCIGAAIMPMAILAPLAPTWWMAIAAMCMVVMGHAIWVTNLMTLPTDLFPPHEVGTAAGFSGMGGAIGGALASWSTGSIVSHFSYLPLFICAGLLHPIAMLLMWRFLPERGCSEIQNEKTAK